MNLLTLRTRLRKRIGGPTVLDVTDASLNDYINETYAEIADRFQFHRTRTRTQFSTVIGTASYVLASTNIVREVWDRTNGKRLDKVGERFVAQTDFVSAVNAKPTKYFRFQDKIQLFPTPDGVYSIEVFAVADVTVLAADGDTPVLPLTWHRGILLLSTYYFYADEAKDGKKAAESKNEYKDWVTGKTVEVREESAAVDTGIDIPTLRAGTPRQDFDVSEL